MTATMNFRGVVVRTLSDAVGDLVRVRASAYVAYRRGLGADGEHLPATFEEVVEMAIWFADPVLSADAPRRCAVSGRGPDMVLNSANTPRKPCRERPRSGVATR